MTDLRAFAAIGALLLAGCSQQQAPAEEEVAPDDDSAISCAIGTASEFTRNCVIDRSVEDGVLFLVIRHEDGSFRRLRVETDGSGVSSADGADQAEITVFDGEIEVSLGGDRYLVPATIMGNGPE